jgi:hypothetical protein
MKNEEGEHCHCTKKQKAISPEVPSQKERRNVAKIIKSLQTG